MTTGTIAPVTKSITVRAPIERAFEVFTAGYDLWNPREHAMGPLEEFVFETKQGGRIYERFTDGTECDEGEVLVWEPPHRFVASWAVSPQWTVEEDPAKRSEYEVRFTAVSDTETRVDLEHRHFERHGEGADGMRAAVDAPNGWAESLEAFAKAAESPAT